MSYLDEILDGGKEPSEFVVAEGAKPHVIERFSATAGREWIWCSCLNWNGPADGRDGFQGHRRDMGLAFYGPGSGSAAAKRKYAKRPGRNGIPLLVLED
jgi:hypothetical protein